MTWKKNQRVLVWDKSRIGRIRRIDGKLALVELTDALTDPPAGYAAWWPLEELAVAVDSDPPRTDPRGAASDDTREAFAGPVPDVPIDRLREPHGSDA